MGDQEAIIIVLTHGEFSQPLWEGRKEVNVCRTRRGKIADFSVVWPLSEVYCIDELRDEKIQVHIALAMAVRRHIYRHAIDTREEIGAVVQVKTSQEILIGLAR